MSSLMEVSTKVVSTWIKRTVFLLGILKIVEIGVAFLHKFTSSYSAMAPDKLNSEVKLHKAAEKGFLYQRLQDADETKLSHGPKDSVVRKRPLLERLSVPHILGFSQAIIPPGSSVERHIHLSKYETFFCQEGQGFVNIGRTEKPGSEDTVLEMMPGSCVTVMPQFYHSLHNNGTRDLILLYFGVEQ